MAFSQIIFKSLSIAQFIQHIYYNLHTVYKDRHVKSTQTGENGLNQQGGGFNLIFSEKYVVYVYHCAELSQLLQYEHTFVCHESSLGQMCYNFQSFRLLSLATSHTSF